MLRRSSRRGRAAGVPLEQAAPSLERLLEVILAFWGEGLIDPGGGYALGHDVHGRPTGADSRQLVAQARTAWFFARLARSPYGHERHLEWAAHGIAFLRERMWDADHGGLFWEVGPDGPRDDSKNIYGQSFGVFVLAEFARAAGDDDAGRLALELAEQMRRAAHDERYGGYIENLARDWSPEPPGQMSKLGFKNRVKTANSHLHLLEAFTSLAEVCPEPWVMDALRELILVMTGPVVDHGARTFREPVERDWAWLPESRSSYGHDVEGVWLLMQACRVAAMPDGPLEPLYRAFWDSTLEYGFDHRRGGLFDSGRPNRRADRREKVWWAQAEALPSALEMFHRTGDERYRRAFELTLAWCESRQADWEGGDWHAVIDTRGVASGAKAGPWKDPYHQGRAVIECLDALGARAQTRPAGR